MFSTALLWICLELLKCQLVTGQRLLWLELEQRSGYISNLKLALFLAVSLVNADLANSDTLQMARIADPDGNFVNLSLLNSKLECLQVPSFILFVCFPCISLQVLEQLVS